MQLKVRKIGYSSIPNSTQNTVLVPQLAIFSQADRLQPHRYKADESYIIGDSTMTPVQAYLDIEGTCVCAQQGSGAKSVSEHDPSTMMP